MRHTSQNCVITIKQVTARSKVLYSIKKEWNHLFWTYWLYVRYEQDNMRMFFQEET